MSQDSPNNQGYLPGAPKKQTAGPAKNSPTEIRPETRQRIARQIQGLCGIVLGPDKDYLLIHRVIPLAHHAGCSTLDQLCDRLDSQANPLLREALIEAVTTHETSFFRDAHPWDALKSTIIPGLLKSPDRSGKLRIWSAACSSGQEAYSLAMVVTEVCEALGLDPQTEVSILGTDISERMLAIARTGVFSAAEVKRGMPPQRQQKFLTPCDKGFEVSPKLQSLIRWQRGNLLDNLMGLGRFDLILCRNLLIYLDEPTRKRLVEALVSRLEPHGLLLVGAAESLFGLTPKVIQKTIGSSLVYQGV